MPDEVSPLCCVQNFNPALQFKFCSMHVVNLGVLPVHSGSIVAMLLEHRRFSWNSI